MVATQSSQDETLEFFDRLIEQRVPLDGLVTSAAAFASAAVGIVFRDSPAIARGPAGEEIDSAPPASAAVLETAQGQVVWVDDPGRDHTDARFLLRRLAVAAQALSPSPVEALPSRVPPLEILIRAGVSEPLLLESLRRLRLRADEPVRVQVGEGRLDQWSAFLDAQLHRRLVARASLQSLHVALWAVPSEEAADLIAPGRGIVVAESTTFAARQVNTAFENARSALRFAPIASLTAGQSGTLIRYEDLGAFAALAALSQESIEALPDVQKLDDFVREHGPEALAVLEAFASSESQRQAATLLHRHHNSVSYWVKRAETRLGFHVSAPAQRSRLFLALVLHRLRNTATTTPAGGPGGDIRL